MLSLLLDVVLLPAVAVGVVLGLAAALLLHWLAPPTADLILVEAGFVAAGFVAGLLYTAAAKKQE